MAKVGDAVTSIKQAATQDPSIVAVTGLGISVEQTRVAVSELAASRLPTLGTLLSATKLSTATSQYYHQVGPTNSREAEVAAYYAATHGAHTAAVYYSGIPADLYSADLAGDVSQAMVARGITTAGTRTRPRRAPATANRSTNSVRKHASIRTLAGSSSTLVAPSAWKEFLGALQASCEGRYPRIILGDDVNRFAQQGDFAAFPNLPVAYMSFGSSLSWPGTNCEGAIAAVGFYSRYQQQFNDCASTRDGVAAIGYDAGFVLRQAIERGRRGVGNPPSGDLILGELNKMTASNQVVGASGPFQVSSAYGDGHIPLDKATTVLEVRGGGAPTEALLCGTLNTAVPPPDPACPRDAG